jgi:hypothetical protein
MHNLTWFLRPAWRFWTVAAIGSIFLLRAVDARWRQAPQWTGLAFLAVLPFLWFAVFAHHSTLWAPVTSRYLFFPLAIVILGATSPPSPRILRALRRVWHDARKDDRKPAPERVTD